MKKRTLPPDFLLATSFVIFIHAMAFAQSGTPAKTARRLSFVHGAITIQVNGTLSAKQDGAYYVIRARAGQHMIVHTATLTASGDLVTLATVTSPSGAQDGEKRNVNFNADLTEDGDYINRVTRNLMATNGSGAGPFLLEFVIY